MLLLVYDVQVYELWTFLVRWKCVTCGRTFRHYPDGVAPYKRYLVTVLLIYCRRYLEEPHTTYRRLANSAGPLRRQPIFYANAVADKTLSERQKALEQPRALAHSTIWQWLRFFAELWKRRLKRCERRQIAADWVDFEPWAITPGKFNTADRYKELVMAGQMLALYDNKKYYTEIKTLYLGP